jgi:hypothetical protein
MSKNVYEAVRAKLRAEGQKAVATIELLLTKPTAFPNNTNIVEEISRLALHLVQAEGALLTFEQYFSQLYMPPPAPPRPPDDEIKVVTPEMSPTLRRELESQALRASATKKDPPQKKRKNKKRDE